jgi:5-(hydroxymethyl)furfural/furfural oxidase
MSSCDCLRRKILVFLSPTHLSTRRCPVKSVGTDDPRAVTDNHGRVCEIARLRVVDALLFPAVPCANTNFPTLMTAEKISAAMVA